MQIGLVGIGVAIGAAAVVFALLVAALYRRGNFGYGQVKTALADAADAHFAAARQRRAELAADPQRIDAILADGAARARQKASEVLLRAQKACGIKR